MDFSNAVVITLKDKYLSGYRGRQKSKHNDGRRYHRIKITGDAKRRLAPQPKMVMKVDGATGHWIMERI